MQTQFASEGLSGERTRSGHESVYRHRGKLSSGWVLINRASDGKGIQDFIGKQIHQHFSRI